MQPFSFTVEGSADELSDEITRALDNVTAHVGADEATAATAHTLGDTAADLAESELFGAGVDRYSVSVTGAKAAGQDDPAAPLHSVSLVLTTVARTDTASSGEPAGQVNPPQV